ncbi:YxeA family protein [Bacillus sp. REN10]|uniref:YxeA family protein n=1 Tax=Bacillus sp. REN10 TaxID=2782541 RepID=UPI00193B12DC|nr:YxeA family protein [Bacillus sp. REN10]
MKIVKLAMGTVIVAAIIICSFTFFVKNELADMLNPFIPKKDVFVKIEGPGQQVEPKTFEYTLTGMNEDGKDTTITFTASKQLREGAYLKLATKRTYVQSWEEIPWNEISADIQDKMD